MKDGFDPLLEHDARVRIAEAELREYFVDRAMAERQAARQAVEDGARQEEEAPAAPAPPADEALAAAAPQALAAAPAEEAPAA